ARGLGATHVVNASDGDDGNAILEITGPDGADVCVDTTGNPHVLERAVQLPRGDGRTVLVGVPAQGDDVTLHTLQLHFGKRLIGSHGGEAAPARDIPRVIQLVEAKRLDLSPLISDRVSLDRVNDAIDATRA